MSQPSKAELDSEILEGIVSLGGYCIKTGLHSYEEWATYLRKELEQEDNPNLEPYLEEAWKRLLPFHKELMNPSPQPNQLALPKEGSIQPRVTYEFSRLCFKKDIIEGLSPSDEFRIITPVGTFQMSKAQFYEVFPNVVQSRSYQVSGSYHYPTIPEKAEQFLLRSATFSSQHQDRSRRTAKQQTLVSPNTLQNRYRIVRQLGKGGMGTVYEAFDTRLSRTVALKKTHSDADELRRAFEREARLLANLNHPALPRVIDHFAEGQEQFLVMDYIPGDDLKALLVKRGRPFPAENVLRWADELLDALEYLHNHEPAIIHRDIKPANLKLTEKGKVVLLDFGLAKGTAGQMTAVTLSRSIHGYSPHFAPLEQMQGERTTTRSDLYSLAATLYYLLTGRMPSDALMRATAIINDEPDPLIPIQNLHPDAPQNLAVAVMSALSLKPNQRPQSAAEMRHILKNGTDNLHAPKHRHAENDHPLEIADSATGEKKPFNYKSFYGWIVAITLVFSAIPYIAGASISTVILFTVIPVSAFISLAAFGLCSVLIEENKLKKTSALLTWTLLFAVTIGLYFLTGAMVSAASYPLLTYCLIMYWLKRFSRK